MLELMVRWVALALIALVAACGSEPEPAASPLASPQASPAPPPSPESESPSPGDEATECEDATVEGEPQVTITQNDNVFSPDCLIVFGGQGLEIVNEGANRHNFTIEGTDVDLDTDPGESAQTEAISGTVEPGSHQFFCKFHRSLGMEGEITVSEAG